MMGYYKLYANIYSFHKAAVSSFFGYESCNRKKNRFVVYEWCAESTEQYNR